MRDRFTSRFLSQLRRLATGALLALPLACSYVGTSIDANRSELVVAAAMLECPVGSEGCPCTPGGGCDPGLYCDAGYCTSGGDGGGYHYEYDFEDDMLASEPAPAIESKRSFETISVLPGRASGGRMGKNRPAKLEKQKRREGRNFAKDAAGSAAPAPEESSIDIPKPEPVSVTGNETDEEPITEDEGDEARQIIYTADLQVAVYELDAAIEFAESLPTRYGGWIESRYDYQITLRLPAERLFEAIEQLSALGMVLGKTLRADDVTDEYTDLESRILVLEQLVEQLELLLKKAKTVEEALKIRVELDRVRIELEAARVRMRQLSELIDFSTLTLHLSQRGPVEALPSSNDPFPWVDDLGVETTEYR